MPHVSVKEILGDGRERGYGVASLMGSNIEMCVALIKAAEELGSSLLLVYNEEVNARIPMEFGIPTIVNAAKQSKAPVGTVLDHGRDLKQISRAIELGINTVMFDGSLLPYEENISKTREIVNYAHRKGVHVEAELGSIAGSALDYASAGPEAHYTNPDVAVEFIERTGIDFLAISFGNAHGIYNQKPVFDLDLVRTIFNKTTIPLVMHGASGLDYGEYPKIIKAGITKVCYYTAMARGAATNILSCLSAMDKAAYHDIVDCSFNYFYNETKYLMRLFGSVGSAVKTLDEAIEVIARETIDELLNTKVSR
jgi:fructose-bisphosphate aldolase, class II